MITTRYVAVPKRAPGEITPEEVAEKSQWLKELPKGSDPDVRVSLAARATGLEQLDQFRGSRK